MTLAIQQAQIGNNIDIYSDDFGNTTGTIGGDSINPYTDDFGNTTGKIDGRSVNCYTGHL